MTMKVESSGMDFLIDLFLFISFYFINYSIHPYIYNLIYIFLQK